jgi:hypothetical protein
MYSLFGPYMNELQRKNIYKRLQKLRERVSCIANADVFQYTDHNQIGGVVVVENIVADVDELDKLGVFEKFDIHWAEYDWRQERTPGSVINVNNVQEIANMAY